MKRILALILVLLVMTGSAAAGYIRSEWLGVDTR